MKRLSYLILFVIFISLIDARDIRDGEDEFLFLGNSGYSTEQMKKDTGFAITNGDMISIVRGGICSIPGFGAIIDSVFGVVFSKLWPTPPEIEYVTKESFEKRVDELANDMRNYTDVKIEESIYETCQAQYDSIRIGAQNYRSLMNVWKNQMRKNNDSSPQVKINLPAVFYDLLTKMEDALRVFSIKERIHVLAKLYIDTSFMYLALLQDAHYFGNSMGLVPELHEGSYESSTPEDNIFSFKFKIHRHSIDSLNNYGQILSNIMRIKSGIRCNISTSFCPKQFTLPNWSALTSAFLYADLSLYDRPHYFIDGTNSDKFSFETKSDPIGINKEVEAIYIVDFCYIARKIVVGAIWKNPYDKFKQSFDFVTGLYGLHYDHALYRGTVGQKLFYDEPNNSKEQHVDGIGATFSQDLVFKNSSNSFKIRIVFAEPWTEKKTHLTYMKDSINFKIINNKNNDILLNTEVSISYQKDFGYEDFVRVGTAYTDVTSRSMISTPWYNIDTDDIKIVIEPFGEFLLHFLSLEVVTRAHPGGSSLTKINPSSGNSNGPGQYDSPPNVI